MLKIGLYEKFYWDSEKTLNDKQAKFDVIITK